MSELYPLLFEPNLHEVVWGGNRLKPWKHLPADEQPIGESWEVSSIPQSESIISNGAFKGCGLNSITKKYGARILGNAVANKYGDTLPLLVKFIDAQRDLSIQVHPNDEMAHKYHNKNGKTEMWYIIDAQPGATLLAGFKQRITPYEYAARVKDGTICDVLARHDVHSGDVFYIPAGRVHAICGGILLVEVQQSSDVTYRIFDYNRPGIDGKMRPLHTELAAEAIDYQVLDDYRTNYLDQAERAIPIIRSENFNIRVLDITHPFHRNMLKYDSFIISICLDGQCNINVRSQSESCSIFLEKGHSCLIPAEIADYNIIPVTPEVRIMETFIDNMDNSLTARINRFFHLSKM